MYVCTKHTPSSNSPSTLASSTNLSPPVPCSILYHARFLFVVDGCVYQNNSNCFEHILSTQMSIFHPRRIIINMQRHIVNGLLLAATAVRLSSPLLLCCVNYFCFFWVKSFLLLWERVCVQYSDGRIAICTHPHTERRTRTHTPNESIVKAKGINWIYYKSKTENFSSAVESLARHRHPQTHESVARKFCETCIMGLTQRWIAWVAKDMKREAKAGRRRRQGVERRLGENCK